MIFPDPKPDTWKSLTVGIWSHFHAPGFKFSFNKVTNVYWVTISIKPHMSMVEVGKTKNEFYELQKLHWILSGLKLVAIKIPEKMTKEQESKLIDSVCDDNFVPPTLEEE
jgi:hypothetical protein